MVVFSIGVLVCIDDCVVVSSIGSEVLTGSSFDVVVDIVVFRMNVVIVVVV